MCSRFEQKKIFIYLRFFLIRARNFWRIVIFVVVCYAYFRKANIARTQSGHPNLRMYVCANMNVHSYTFKQISLKEIGF